MLRSYLRSFVLVALSALACALPASAQYTINKLTNKSGGAVAAARVVVADSANASAFTTTTTADYSGVIGVTTAAVNNNAIGSVAMLGVSEVYCAGAVALGDYLGTTTVAGQAASNGSTLSGSFAIALEAGTDATITCLLLGGTKPTVTGTVSPSSISLPDGIATIIQGTDSDIQYGYDEATDDRWEMSDGTNTFLWVKDMGTEGDAGITGNFYVQDDDFFILGDDSDIRFSYDELTDNRLEVTDAAGNVLFTITDGGSSGNVGVTGTLTTENLTANGASIQLGDAIADLVNTKGTPMFEGSVDDGFQIIFDIPTLTADRSITWRDAAGTVILSGDTFTGDVTATLDSDGSTALTLSALSADWNQTGAFDITLNNASSELKILESAGATYYGIFDVTDLTADRTYTFPDSTGTVQLQGVAGSFTTLTTTSTSSLGGIVTQSNTNPDYRWVDSDAHANDYASIRFSQVTDGSTSTDLDVRWWDNSAASQKQLQVWSFDDSSVYFPSTGDVYISNAAGELKIKESSGDTYYGIFDITDLGADRTYTFPNVSGTVVTTGDTGSVTSAMVASDLANADIAAGAAIAETKLALARIYWLNAGAIWPAASGGCSTPALDANNNVACAFAASTTGYMSVPVPSNYDGSTENVSVYWYKATDTNSVTWTIDSVVIADDGDETATTATGTITNTAAPTTATNVQIDTPTSTTFFGASSNAGKWARIKISTNAYTGGTASLLGIKVEY